jgi:integrase
MQAQGQMRPPVMNFKITVLIGYFAMLAKKGGVAIEDVKGRIRLRWRVSKQSKPVSMAVGAARDPICLLRAEQVALQIAIDLANVPRTYDATLNRYRRMVDPHQAACVSVGVLDLFKEFYKYKSKHLEYGSLSKWEAVQGHLAVFAHKEAAQLDERLCQAFFDGLSQLAAETRRSYLSILKACWVFGQLRHGLMGNPWALVQLPRAEKREPDPFSAAEVGRILAGFAGQYHYPFVCCLLALGCRPGEASALTWADVDFESGQVAITKSWDGRSIKATKNRKNRVVPMVATLVTILIAHRPDDWQPSGTVFPAKKGGRINLKMFLKRQWIPTLERMGVRYRSTYKCRHTVWSHAVLSMPIAEAAQRAGNLPTTLLTNYIGSVTASPMPDLLSGD